MMNIKMKNTLELFKTNIGSHMWKMNHENSDIDIAVIYLMDSRDWMLGKIPKGKQIQTGEYDYTYYELEHVINHLLKGNCNYLWAVMSPLIDYGYRTAIRDLRQIVSTNLAKNCFFSINGLSKHNIYHYITGEKTTEIDIGYLTERKMSRKTKAPIYEIDTNSKIYKKKLNVIGRTILFGINLLVWGKCMFEKVNVENVEDLWALKNKLNESFKNSHLPEKPDPKPFEDYLIKWRIKKMKMDGLI